MIDKPMRDFRLFLFQRKFSILIDCKISLMTHQNDVTIKMIESEIILLQYFLITQ